jgi:hypothetical protein
MAAAVFVGVENYVDAVFRRELAVYFLDLS